MAHLRAPGDPQDGPPPRDYSGRTWGERLATFERRFYCNACGRTGPSSILRIDPLTESVTCVCGAVQRLAVSHPGTRPWNDGRKR